MSTERDIIALRAGSYANLLAAVEAGDLAPREPWVVPPGYANEGLYIGNPITPGGPPLPIGGGGGGFVDSPQCLTVPVGSTPTEAADLLQATVDAAAELTPNGSALSATNYATVFIPPAFYDFGTGDGLLLANPYIRLVGLGASPGAVWIKSTRLTAGGTIRQTANHVEFYNMTWEIAGSGGNDDISAYYPDGGVTNTVLQDIDIVVGAGLRAMRRAINTGTIVDMDYSGIYRRVRSTAGLWKGFDNIYSGKMILSGLFEDCEGGDDSFGGTSAGFSETSLITGTLRRCRAGAASFCSVAGDSSALFEDCVAETSYSSGTWSSFNVHEATLRRCILTSKNPYGGDGIAAASTFTGRAEDCIVRITASSGNFTALRIGAGARVYGGTYIGSGSAKSIDAPSAVTAAIAHVRTNKGIGTNITNSIGTPYNVEDADLS